MDVVVRDMPERDRYEVYVGGALAGFADYRRANEQVLFTHTEVDPEFQHRGIAGELVRAALDAERAAGHTVRPLCSYVAHWIRQHPDYADLLTQRQGNH